MMKKSLTSAALAITMALTSAGPSAAASCLRGINISGAEFGSAGGVLNKDYTWPSTETLDYFAAKGFNSVRLPFRWERLQPVLMGPLDEAELSRLMETVELIRARKMRIILAPHNFARYNERVVGSTDVPKEAFADFWAKLAAEVGSHKAIYGYGLMNEPHGLGSDAVWPAAAQAAVDAIRAVDKTNTIIVGGDDWSSAKM